MIVAPFKVVLDANVLFPFTLRDTLLRAAADGLFQLYWSEEILNEMERNLAKTGATVPDKAARLRRMMMKAFPEALVTKYESLIAGMTNDPKDRHVAAAAVKAGAQVIVTMNLKDFRSLPDGIEAQSPDEFLSNLFDLSPEGIANLLRKQASTLKHPPRSFEELLTGLSRIAPEFVAGVREHVDGI